MRSSHRFSIDGACLTIRKFSADPYGADDLVSFGTMTAQTVELLDACVRAPEHPGLRGTRRGEDDDA